MKISIITPSFNQGQFIEETIDSILSQQYPDLEYIVIDGGSTDNTLEIIKKYQKHLTYWVSEKDSGQSHAINKGLHKASGDIVNWINSDDYLEQGALKTIAEAFENPETNVFIGRSNIVKNGKIIRQSRGTDIYPGNLPKTIGLARIDQPEHWWRKSVIDQIGSLNTNLHYIMDRDWWIKYLLRFGLNGIEKTDTILANFRLHGTSKTVSENSAFNTERNAYFATLAKYNGIQRFPDTIKAEESLIENMPIEINREALKAAFHYFDLLNADEAYVKYNFQECKTFLKSINPNLLDQQSLKLYKNLKFRCQLPTGLIKFARNQNK